MNSSHQSGMYKLLKKREKRKHIPSRDGTLGIKKVYFDLSDKEQPEKMEFDLKIYFFKFTIS